MAINDEVMASLDELETRLDRLRTTYDLYFTGIEKMPPTVQHKDVERRIQVFRKMALRNTSHRFRLQTLIQKYTTYLQHWQRVLRRIEDGTHRRDLARVARYGVRANGGTAASPAGPSDGVYELDASAIEDADSVEEFPDTPTAEDIAVPPVARAAPPQTPPRVAAVIPFDVVETSAPSSAERAALRTAPAAEPVKTPTAQRVGLTAFGVPPRNPPPPGSTGASPAPTGTPAAGVRVPSLGTPAVGVRVPSVGTPAVGTAPPATATPAAGVRVPAPGTPAAGVRVPTPATPAAGVVPPPPAGSVARPGGTSPGQRPLVPAPTPAGPPPRTSSADASLRQLYERYREARKQNGEGDVDFDAVARQVRATLPKIAEKYPGQRVELDVTEKDGKVILRPVVHGKKTP